jgi:hypothetical protein
MVVAGVVCSQAAKQVNSSGMLHFFNLCSLADIIIYRVHWFFLIRKHSVSIYPLNI